MKKLCLYITLVLIQLDFKQKYIEEKVNVKNNIFLCDPELPLR